MDFGPKLAYYNEYDKLAAGWLRELILAGLIPYGEVDDRDIREVAPCRSYRVCPMSLFCWRRRLV